MPMPPIVLDHESGVPVYRQIGEAILTALARQQLASDERMPTIHQLAQDLGVNPNTVARAYRELEQSGHLVGERGRGTFPVAQPPAVKAGTAGDLRKIAARALADCARQGFTAAELLSLLKRNESKPRGP
jgi:GntR family transcriptional regulator